MKFFHQRAVDEGVLAAVPGPNRQPAMNLRSATIGITGLALLAEVFFIFNCVTWINAVILAAINGFVPLVNIWLSWNLKRKLSQAIVLSSTTLYGGLYVYVVVDANYWSPDPFYNVAACLFGGLLSFPIAIPLWYVAAWLEAFFPPNNENSIELRQGNGTRDSHPETARPL